MTKKTGVFNVDDLGLKINLKTKITPKKEVSNKLAIDKAMKIVTAQMRVSGLRERTINEYHLHLRKFREATNTDYVEDITTQTIYDWLASMNVSNSTKQIRLRCLKAILSKFFDNGYIPDKFWRTINIKVDKKVKQGASESDINVLLSLLDLNTFIGLRDAVAILTLFKTGIRINTLGQLEEKHIDFKSKTINLDGAILKNHDFLKLPFDDQLCDLFRILIQQNDKVREYYNENNLFIFISQRGTSLTTKSTNNAISKQLYKYAKMYDLQNINAHAIRRGFAKKLLNKGASVALISKALGHSDLAVTTQYLDLGVEEVASTLRDFL